MILILMLVVIIVMTMPFFIFVVILVLMLTLFTVILVFVRVLVTITILAPAAPTGWLLHFFLLNLEHAAPPLFNKSFQQAADLAHLVAEVLDPVIELADLDLQIATAGIGFFFPLCQVLDLLHLGSKFVQFPLQTFLQFRITVTHRFQGKVNAFRLLPKFPVTPTQIIGPGLRLRARTMALQFTTGLLDPSELLIGSLERRLEGRPFRMLITNVLQLGFQRTPALLKFALVNVQLPPTRLTLLGMHAFFTVTLDGVEFLLQFMQETLQPTNSLAPLMSFVATPHFLQSVKVTDRLFQFPARLFHTLDDLLAVFHIFVTKC